MKKTAAESHRILVGVYGEHALAERTCQTQEDLAESLDVTQAAISKRLKSAGYPWREGNALCLVGSEGCPVL